MAGPSVSDEETATFTAKDLDVDWEKVDRASALVDLALKGRDAEGVIVVKARRLERFYSHLVRVLPAMSSLLPSLIPPFFCLCLFPSLRPLLF